MVLSSPTRFFRFLREKRKKEKEEESKKRQQKRAAQELKRGQVRDQDSEEEESGAKPRNSGHWDVMEGGRNSVWH